MRKKIALVSNTSWSIYNFRLGLIRRLKERGIDVVVIAPKDSFTAKLIAEGISFKQINISNYGTNPFNELKIAYSLFKIYRQIRPDLIFHYTIKPNIYGSFAAALCKVPSIIVTTGMGQLFAFKNYFVRVITLILYRIAAALSREVWFLNEDDRDQFISKMIVRQRKTKILKSEGIDTDWFKLNTERNYENYDRFLFAGRLLWDKGIKGFVDAAREIKKHNPKIRFEILGFIDESNPNSVPYQVIEKWQKNKWIKYLGETTDVRPYLKKSTCLVFPSFYREGVSRILMEAASMETPIITSDNVGCRDVVDHGKNGFIVQPKNQGALLAAIREFIRMSPQDKMVMGKLGRMKILNEFDEKLILQEYEQTVSKYLEIDPSLFTKTSEKTAPNKPVIR